MPRESNDKRRGRWDAYEWFDDGLRALLVEASKAKDKTKDDFKRSKLEGYLECAQQMKTALVEQWNSEARKCPLCGRAITMRNAKKYCSPECYNKRQTKAARGLSTNGDT